jgi:hypothetical protein
MTPQSPALALNFLRRLAMWTSTMWSSPQSLSPQTISRRS